MVNKLTIYIDGWCPICKKFKRIVTKLDFFKLIVVEDIRTSDILDEKKIKLMFSKSSNDLSFYGFDSIFEINKRLVILWVLLPFTFVLKITKIGSFLYNELSVKRKIIPLSCDTECKLN
jgi:predicted DCC family thiol-disulfide oxidoreductase YuxK